MGLGAAGLKKTHPAQWVGLEDGSAAVGGLGRLMWAGLICCLFVGGGLEDFLFIHLKSPWTAFHGSAVL